jgi:hypothetical protein
MMRLYHRTDAAAAIIRDGFRDGVGNYLTDRLWSGVWLADEPLDGNEGAYGQALLAVEIDADESALVNYEWIEDGKGFREWLIPASILNVSMVSLKLLMSSRGRRT